MVVVVVVVKVGITAETSLVLVVMLVEAILIVELVAYNLLAARIYCDNLTNECFGGHLV